MIKFGWKGFGLALIIYMIFAGAFNAGVGAVFAVATIVILIVIQQKENREDQKKNIIEDYTVRDTTLSGQQVDLLYRRYASVIDGYHITPIRMFTDVFSTKRDQVFSDLNVLINNGRFQRARIEYDDDTFVVDEYTKQRGFNENYGRSAFSDEKKQQKKTFLYRKERESVVSAIEETVPFVRDEKMRNILSGIESKTNEILTRLSEDQNLVTGDVRRFLTFYLPKTIECVEHYRHLLEKNYLTDLEKGAITDLESALETIDKAFRKICDSLTNSDAVDISAEARAVQQMLENDGLTDDCLHTSKESDNK